MDKRLGNIRINVRVKIFGSKEFDQTVKVDKGEEVQGLFSHIPLEKDDASHYTFLVNGEVKTINTKLTNGDVVAIFPTLGGG